MALLSNDFVKIAPRTSLFTPEKYVTGQLVVVCSWLGAARKHIYKYTTFYQKAAPGARILLIEADIPILTSSYENQRKAIRPAASTILETLADCEKAKATSNEQRLVDVSDGAVPSPASEPKPKIVLHVFSNGGTNTATHLLMVLNAQLKAALPITGLFLDSCPAKGTYWRSYDAMVLSLPKGFIIRMLGAVVVHCILVMLYSWIWWGNENPATLNRRTLLDEEILAPSAGGKKGARVCYLYSKEDRMTLWTDVKAHAEEAREKGWLVQEVLFEGSGHCAHFSKDEERYGGAVKSIWDVEGSRVVRRKIGL